MAGLFERSLATLVGSWGYLAAGSPGAEVVETDGAVIAAFVHSPDREFLNNAVLGRGLGDPGPALDAIERAYARHGIDRYAVWLHESDSALAGEVEARGYRYDSSTRSMAMAIADFGVTQNPGLDLVDVDPTEFWRLAEVEGLAPQLDPGRAHFYVARWEGKSAATLMAFDHEGDCGIYMVGTAPAARRRGIATALSAHAVAAARERGCTTVSLQSTPMAEGVYRSVGFGDLGRFDEYVPV